MSVGNSNGSAPRFYLEFHRHGYYGLAGIKFGRNRGATFDIRCYGAAAGEFSAHTRSAHLLIHNIRSALYGAPHYTFSSVGVGCIVPGDKYDRNYY